MNTLSSYLRKLAAVGQHGQTRTPVNYYMGSSYTSFYWDNHGIVPNHETWRKVAELSKRYRSFVHYCTEIAPLWTPMDRIHYADNSVEEIQISAVTGTHRQVMITAPSGDVC